MGRAGTCPSDRRRSRRLRAPAVRRRRRLDDPRGHGVRLAGRGRACAHDWPARAHDRPDRERRRTMPCEAAGERPHPACVHRGGARGARRRHRVGGRGVQDDRRLPRRPRPARAVGRGGRWRIPASRSRGSGSPSRRPGDHRPRPVDGRPTGGGPRRPTSGPRRAGRRGRPASGLRSVAASAAAARRLDRGMPPGPAALPPIHRPGRVSRIGVPAGSRRPVAGDPAAGRRRCGACDRVRTRAVPHDQAPGRLRWPLLSGDALARHPPVARCACQGARARGRVGSNGRGRGRADRRGHPGRERPAAVSAAARGRVRSPTRSCRSAAAGPPGPGRPARRSARGSPRRR